MKTKEQKQKLLDQIRKTPIIQIASEKTGISRATYYRWLKLDEKFKESAEQALSEGIELINEMAESQLISAIRNQNITSIIFWLKNRHKAYKTRVEISGKVSTESEILNEEQQAIMKQALKMSGLLQEGDSNNIINPNQNDGSIE